MFQTYHLLCSRLNFKTNSFIFSITDRNCIIFTIFMLIVFSLILCLTTVWSKPARPQSLPKIVWTYQQTIDTNLIHSLCLHRVKSMLQNSRWVLEVLTPTNLFTYLHKHEQYKLMLRNHKKYLTFVEEVEIAKLMILQEYGGLWIDPSVILLEHVDWIHHLSSEKGIETYGNTVYQMVLFSPQHFSSKYSKTYLLKDQESIDSSILSINLDIILALKEAPIMQSWSSEFSKQIQQMEIDPSEQVSIQDKIKGISKKILANLLVKSQEKDKFKQYNIWRLFFKDYYYEFRPQANTDNAYVLTDFYLKYPLHAISNQFQNSNHFIFLQPIENELNEILNPNVSKLQSSHGFHSMLKTFQGSQCQHFILETSIIYNLLIKETRFEELMKGLVVEDEQKIKQCAFNFKKGFIFIMGSAITAIQYTLSIILMYIVIVIQKNCVKLMWMKARLFFRPRFTLMLNILKAIKGIIQYSSTNEV